MENLRRLLHYHFAKSQQNFAISCTLIIVQ